MTNLVNLNIDKSKWEVCRLGDVALDVTERVENPAKSVYGRFVGLEHFESGELKIRRWGATEKVTSSAKAFKPGDVLFARRNAYLRRASLVDFTGCCSGDAFVLRELHERLVPGFLPLIVNSTNLWDFANSNAAGTMSKRVKWGDLASFKIELPPKDEQLQINELVWSLYKVLENDLTLQVANLNFFESSRNAIFDTVSSDHQFNVYRDSRQKEIKFSDLLATKMLNGIYKSKEFQGTGLRIINMGELFAYPIIEDQDMSLISLTEKEKKQYLVEEGDLIFARRSIVVEGAGRCSIIGLHKSPMTFESSMIRVRLNRNIVNPKYVYHFLKSKEGKKRIRTIVGFTTIAGITGSDLANIKVPVVSMHLQNQIVNFLDQYDSLFSSFESKVNSTRTTLNSLINHIF